MANETNNRDWNNLLVNTLLSAAVGAAVSHFLREHTTGRTQAQSAELQERQSQILQQQQSQLDRLLASTRFRPHAPPPPVPMHGLPPYGQPAYAQAGYPQPAYAQPAYAPSYPALPGGSRYGEER